MRKMQGLRVPLLVLPGPVGEVAAEVLRRSGWPARRGG
jgi:hypothetical protein